MFRSSKKFVAVFMMLWLPLFGSSALAASVSMQMPQGECHEAAIIEMSSHDDMSAHHQHHSEMSSVADEQTSSCDTCDVCHMACTGYLAIPKSELFTVQTAARETTPYLLAFVSFTSAPLVPPPLVAA